MSEDHDKTRPSTAQTSSPDPAGAVSVDLSGQVVVSADVLARAGIAPGQDVVIEADQDGVRLVPDALRKVYVESTSRCNLACPMCVRHGWQEPLGEMPVGRFERLVAGLPASAGAPTTIAFGGFGEPLVHPEWRRLLAVSREAGARVEVTTNGLLLGPAAAAAMVDHGVSQVTVSVDGGDADAYTRMRGVTPDSARAAVVRLIDARRHARQPMAVGVAAVATRTSIGSLPALLDWAFDLKLDFVSIGGLVPHTDEMARETLWERAGWASVFRPPAWRPQVQVGRFDIERVTRPLAAALVDHGLAYPSPLADDARWRNRCRFAHEGMCAVSWDGRVAPCLSLLHDHTELVNAQTRRVHAFVVGRIDERPLEAVWRDAAFREFRRRVREFDYPPCFFCGGCALTETNDEDCYGNPAPVCGECLWAQGIVLCP
jgi:MoaA/NifB/PqqE/SkfB family radical SAM enzyme